ncbi:hypothetical protein MHYP_G00131270 [Metynnis hypsauchen]
MSSTGAHGSPLLIDEDQVQNVTIAVKEMLSLFTAVTVEDGEHALKKLHRSIIDAVYTDLVRRMTSEYRLTEAVKTNSEQLPGSLARSIIIALKNADHKGCESEERLTDRQLQVMLGGLHQMFTRDDITRLSTDIEKIVTTVSQKKRHLLQPSP